MEFDKELKKENNMKPIIDKFYYKLGFIKSERQDWDNPIGRANQRDDIDTILTWKTGTLVTVSEKFRFTDYNDLLLEVITGDSIGSTFKSRAEKLVYATPNNIYCLNMKDVKDVTNFLYKQEIVQQTINSLKKVSSAYNKTKFKDIECLDYNNNPICIKISKAGNSRNNSYWYNYNIIVDWDIIINNFNIPIRKFEW